MALLLHGGCVWDGLAAEPHQADVWIDDGVITAVASPTTAPGPQDLRVDLDGAYLLPGLIDMHVHLVWSGGPDPAVDVERDGEQLTTIRAFVNAQEQLGAGVTTLRDLGSNWDVALTVGKTIDRGHCEGPTVIASGRTVIMTGGHDPFWGIFSDGVDAVTSAVRHQVHAGASVIKTAATGGVYGRPEGEEVGQAELSREELAALATEAHSFGLKTAAHALGTEGIRNAVLAGVDTIEHGIFLTADIVAAMHARKIVLCPTLVTYRTLAEDKPGVIPDYAVEQARTVVAVHRKSFAMALDAGLSIVAGTDAGASQLPHPALVDELLIMREYGMPILQALRAATSGAARALGRRGTTGTVTPGAPADLVIVERNPFDDLGALRSVWGVVRSGRPLHAPVAWAG